MSEAYNTTTNRCDFARVSYVSNSNNISFHLHNYPVRKLALPFYNEESVAQGGEIIPPKSHSF